MNKLITESEVEQVELDILSELGYKVIYGPDIAMGSFKHRALILASLLPKTEIGVD